MGWWRSPVHREAGLTASFQVALEKPLGRLVLTTLHSGLDLPDLAPFYRELHELPFVSISDDQRRPMPPVNWVGTVYHGLPTDLLRFSLSAAQGYLAFLGRISPEKRPDRATGSSSATPAPPRQRADKKTCTERETNHADQQ